MLLLCFSHKNKKKVHWYIVGGITGEEEKRTEKSAQFAS
jgi:hypothetical protein